MLFFLKIGIFFQNREKSHLNSIGNGAKFRSLRTKQNPRKPHQKKADLDLNFLQKRVKTKILKKTVHISGS